MLGTKEFVAELSKVKQEASYLKVDDLSKMVDKLVALQKGVPATGKEDRPAGGNPLPNVSVLRLRLDSTESG